MNTRILYNGISRFSPWQSYRLLLVACLFFLPGMHHSEAAFTLNFDKLSGISYNTFDDTYYSCGMSHIADVNCSSGGFGSDFQEGGSHDDGTAAFQATFNSGGVDYFHVIIGDKNVDDFYLEYIIEASRTNGDRYDGGRSDAYASASLGDNSTRTNSEYNMDNPYDSDSTKTGTGSANPTRVIMRQITDDGTTYGEFLKAEFAFKPLIHQNAISADINAVFELDMSAKTYADGTPITEADFKNVTNLLTGDSVGDYDTTDVTMTPHFMNTYDVNISAGGFTYATGSGVLGGGGTYSGYAEGGAFQPLNKDYSIFCDNTLNTNWSGNGACTNNSGGGGGWGGTRGGW